MSPFRQAGLTVLVVVPQATQDKILAEVRADPARMEVRHLDEATVDEHGKSHVRGGKGGGNEGMLMHACLVVHFEGADVDVRLTGVCARVLATAAAAAAAIATTRRATTT